MTKGDIHPASGDNNSREQKRKVTGELHVRGEIEANIPRVAIQEYRAVIQENTPRDNWRFTVECVTLFFVIAVAIMGCIQTRQAIISAGAAQSAAQTAKSTLTASQGAYVTIGRKDGTVAEFATSKDHPDENVPLIVYFQNTGHIPALVAWDTVDRRDGMPESFGIHRITTQTGSAPLPPVTLHKNGELYTVYGRVIAGDSVGRTELAYISRSDFKKLSNKIAGFYIDGFYSYCDQLGTWSTHKFTLNYHTDMPTDLRFELVIDTEIPNPPVPSPVAGKLYFPPCTSMAAMLEAQRKYNEKKDQR